MTPVLAGGREPPRGQGGCGWAACVLAPGRASRSVQWVGRIVGEEDEEPQELGHGQGAGRRAARAETRVSGGKGLSCVGVGDGGRMLVVVVECAAD